MFEDTGRTDNTMDKKKYTRKTNVLENTKD